MSAPAQTATPIAHPTIQRFFEISLYLLIFTGFAMLAGTGKLDALSLILGMSALLGKGYLLARQSDAIIPEHWTTYLTLVYVAFFAFDYFLISQTFIGSLVHMVLFAAMVKVFSIHRERDYLYLAVLAFGMVLAAAVLTVDWLFFGIFCVFVLLAVMTFVSMEMRRSWIAAQPATPTDVRDVRDLTRFPGSVSRACVFLVLSIVLGTVVLFFLIPRKPSAGYLSAFASRADLTTGFSEEVRLGDIGSIQQSTAVLMHVKFDKGSVIPKDLRWRGVALTYFDGRIWKGPHETGGFYRLNPSWPFGYMASRLFLGGGPKVSYTVSLEPFGSRVFFVLPEALSLNGRYQTIRIDSTGSIFNTDTSRAVTDYSVLSEIPPPMPAVVSVNEDRGVSGIVYLQLPEEVDPRIRQLAQRISAKQKTLYGKASAIERYLSSTYGYTLQLPAVTPKDPIANFLFERKQGHCEYFASSMVVMLRTLGIASRIVNGFRGGEYNDVIGSYIVRAKDAHSWVEAYFPGYGWYTFDPTPAAAAVAPNSWSRLYLYLDAMHEFWHEWVVNYDSSHQTTLGMNSVRQGQSGIQHVRNWLQSLYDGSLKRADAMRGHFQHHVKQWAVWMAAGFTLLVVLTLGPKLFFLIRRMQLARRPRLEPHSAASIWYERVLKLLGKRGIRKLSTHTPQEFLKAMPNSPVRERVESFTFHYERARFGDSAEDAEKLPGLYRELELVSKE